jgi:hypothetical protein
MRIVFEPGKKGAKRGSRNMQMMNFALGSYHQVSSGFSNEGRYDGRGVEEQGCIVPFGWKT